MNRLNARLGEWWCQEMQEHDHSREFVPTATEVVAFLWPFSKPVEAKVIECEDGHGPYAVDKTYLEDNIIQVACPEGCTIEPYFKGQAKRWAQIVAGAGFVQTCPHFWDQ